MGMTRKIKASEFVNDYPPKYLIGVDGLALTSTKDLGSTSLRLWPGRNAPPLIEYISPTEDDDGFMLTIWAATTMIGLILAPDTEIEVYEPSKTRNV